MVDIESSDQILALTNTDADGQWKSVEFNEEPGAAALRSLKSESYQDERGEKWNFMPNLVDKVFPLNKIASDEITTEPDSSSINSSTELPAQSFIVMPPAALAARNKQGSLQATISARQSHYRVPAMPRQSNNGLIALSPRQSQNRLPVETPDSKLQAAQGGESHTDLVALEHPVTVLKDKIHGVDILQQRASSALKTLALVTTALVVVQVVIFLFFGSGDTSESNNESKGTATSPAAHPTVQVSKAAAPAQVATHFARRRSTARSQESAAAPLGPKDYVQVDTTGPRHAYQSW